MNSCASVASAKTFVIYSIHTYIGTIILNAVVLMIWPSKAVKKSVVLGPFFDTYDVILAVIFVCNNNDIDNLIHKWLVILNSYVTKLKKDKEYMYVCDYHGDYESICLEQEIIYVSVIKKRIHDWILKFWWPR